MTRTLTAPAQDALWEIPAPAVPAQAPPPLKKTRRFHVLDLPTPQPSRCDPRCLTCGHDEGDGHCNPCAITCRRPLLRVPVEVCLTTTHVTARPAGDRLIAVTCPWCTHTHWHSATAASPYRISGCGKPYIVHTAAPEAEA
ncbi:hypothetical protein SAMN05216275_14140 [Streptosporangium canum]|uniref:Uncharacterized protein n=1 Tax=Streptosporangium canum TaxID=324952 RepID=A0A1I4DGG7_9ACTN|nr:hypothetical protein [Streptosporangium canum]SFK92153.1 hypothetical protein SAMN05216275_14140 [Streptosporangium canum]